MYAVLRSGGKQYRVAVGDEVTLERLDAEEGQSVELGEVLMVADGERQVVGTPLVENALVRATVVSQGRAPKIRIFKYKPKKRYRKRMGHRQRYTRVKIEEIVA